MQPGWMVNKVYAAIKEGYEDKEVTEFLNKQPKFVRDAIIREALAYNNFDTPNVDPVELDYSNSQDPGINFCRPKSRRHRQSTYYSCPKCNGRLFRGMSRCGWCGEDITPSETTPGDLSNEMWLSYLEYIMGDKVGISSILSKDTLAGVDDFVDISDIDLGQEMQTVKQYIPVEAFTDYKPEISITTFKTKHKKCVAVLDTVTDEIKISATGTLLERDVVEAFDAKVAFKGKTITAYAPLNKNKTFTLQASVPFVNYIKTNGKA